MALPAPYQQLVQAFDALPGVGPRAAARLARYVIDDPQGDALAAAITRARAELVLCQRCYRYALTDTCDICAAAHGQQPLFVVAGVEDSERLTGQGMSNQFLLHALLSPVAGIGPAQLHLPQLRARVVNDAISDLRLVLPAGVEAEATAQFITDMLADVDVSISRQEVSDGAP